MLEEYKRQIKQARPVLKKLARGIGWLAVVALFLSMAYLGFKNEEWMPIAVSACGIACILLADRIVSFSIGSLCVKLQHTVRESEAILQRMKDNYKQYWGTIEEIQNDDDTGELMCVNQSNDCDVLFNDIEDTLDEIEDIITDINNSPDKRISWEDINLGIPNRIARIRLTVNKMYLLQLEAAHTQNPNDQTTKDKLEAQKAKFKEIQKNTYYS